MIERWKQDLDAERALADVLGEKLAKVVDPDYETEWALARWREARGL